MSAKTCSHIVEAPGPLAKATFAEAYDFFSSLITYQLRNGIVERLASNHVDGAVVHTSRVSGAIFFSLHPKHLPILIGDARASVALAIQRHLSNEQYRRRLAEEFHYRALRSHLTTSFRLHMVPPSTSDKCHFLADRSPSLAVAYGKEIDRLEADLLIAGPLSTAESASEFCLNNRPALAGGIPRWARSPRMRLRFNGAFGCLTL